jgi:hypothetical protein
MLAGLESNALLSETLPFPAIFRHFLIGLKPRLMVCDPEA